MSDYVKFRSNPLQDFLWVYHSLTSSIINHLKICYLLTAMSFLFTGGIKSFAANPDAVTKWCLNRADQAKNVNALKEIAGIYSSSEKYKPLRPSQILISEKLIAKVIRVLEEEYINPFSVLVAEDCLFNLSSGIPFNNQLAD